jgi:hypothetical protein
MIEPSLIGQKSRDEERNADERDRDLGNHAGVTSVRKSQEASLTLLQTAVCLPQKNLYDWSATVSVAIGLGFASKVGEADE